MRTISKASHLIDSHFHYREDIMPALRTSENKSLPYMRAQIAAWNQVAPIKK